MSIELDLSAIKLAAKRTVAGAGYVATTATKTADSVASVASVATVASSQRLATPEKAPTVAPALDPGLHRLLALAMAYCNHTGASDKARADWHADIAATPVEQRGELAAYLQSQLPAPSLKAQAPTVAPAPDPKPMPKFDQAQPWNEADKAFQAHYWQCPECKAGGRTRGPLCPTGQQLSAAVEQAFAAT